jgi:glycerol kinase
MPELILAIDQGTTGTTALVFDGAGKIRGRAYGEIRQYYPRPGWVEHDAEQIYRSVVQVSSRALTAARVKTGDLAAVGITNQRETFVVWERATGRPLHRAIVWQCRRSSEICERLRDREAEVSRITGLVIDPYFSGTKLKWLLDHDRSLRRKAARGAICFGTIDTWLVFKFSRGGAFVTDSTNASRTMMFDLARRKWDQTMLEMLGVPERMLPAVVASRGPMAEAARGTLGHHAVPIAAIIGDQQSALYGNGCVAAGEAKVTYGTGAFLLIHTGNKRVHSKNRMIATAALGIDAAPAFALEGSVFIAGAAVQWLRDELGLVARSADTSLIARHSRDRGQPYLVPAFVGLGAPYWDSDARGAIVGITRGTTRADVVRATLDSIAYQVLEVLNAMEKDTGRKIRELRADGGASANDYLMQFQADLLRRRVRRPPMAEATALGAAKLAGEAVGLWFCNAGAAPSRGKDRLFAPKMSGRTRNMLVAGWRNAVARVLSGRRAIDAKMQRFV